MGNVEGGEKKEAKKAKGARETKVTKETKETKETKGATEAKERKEMEEMEETEFVMMTRQPLPQVRPDVEALPLPPIGSIAPSGAAGTILGESRGTVNKASRPARASVGADTRRAADLVLRVRSNEEKSDAAKLLSGGKLPGAVDSKASRDALLRKRARVKFNR